MVKSGEGAAECATGNEQAVAAVLTPLTVRARALYEDSIVPVREIATLIGVNQRTLYRYVEKFGWRRRYASPARAAAVAAANRGRRHAPGRAPTAKGAGGRFIRRADEGRPFARGLKALDPAGGARASALCERAVTLSDAALVQARALRAALCDARTLAILARVVRELVDLERTAARAAGGGGRRKPADPPEPPDDDEALRLELARRIEALVGRETPERR